ncbi:Fanconi anemia core complex-associated protein 20 isoform X2 [Poecile atricapillus]|uniref:Fanconi anemia core complex-associated protein 20 isoform X2 n=1 Tax=Poecile atricapillus TaxID=48891 RepID=UPI0027383183|nr:Fanconi anemia core complex-associated protein 20 isoform X2 [Poecile atricapillus]
MCEEEAGKLRLKPRTAPSARGRDCRPGPEPPPRTQALTDRCSWFEKGDLNECEKTWVLLLRHISQDSHCTNWDAMPNFPEFLEKEQQERSSEHHEVFTVRIKDIQWISFPSFHKEKCLNPKDLSSQQPTQSQSNEHKGQGQSATAGKTCMGTSTDQDKTVSGADRKGVSELDVSPKSCKFPGHSSSAQPLALVQSSAEALSPQQHCTGTVQNSRADRKEKGEEKTQIQTHQGDLPVGEATEVSAEKPWLGNTLGAESREEKMENQGEASSALDSCPMCLMQFTGRLSQLDIDGHLARCLSESADDVMW